MRPRRAASTRMTSTSSWPRRTSWPTPSPAGRIEDDMSRRALTDTLTGLPNRALLMDRLGHWRDAAPRSGARAALLFLDLDHFKVINDSLGHDVGDELLRATGPRLQG